MVGKGCQPVQVDMLNAKQTVCPDMQNSCNMYPTKCTHVPHYAASQPLVTKKSRFQSRLGRSSHFQKCPEVFLFVEMLNFQVQNMNSKECCWDGFQEPGTVRSKSHKISPLWKKLKEYRRGSLFTSLFWTSFCMPVLGIFSIRIFGASSFAAQLIGYKAVLPLKDKITKKSLKGHWKGQDGTGKIVNNLRSFYCEKKWKYLNTFKIGVDSWL